MTRALLIILGTGIVACSAEKARPADSSNAAAQVEPFQYDTASTVRYIAEIWNTDSASQPAALAIASAPISGRNTAGGLLVLRAYNGQRVVRVTQWPSAVAENVASGLRAMGGRRVEVLRVQSLARKPAESLDFDSSAFVQFSQFLMRRKPPVDTLQRMAAGMSGGMVVAESTLTLISTLVATDSSTVTFLGKWTGPKGFEIFSERATFSAKPYWDPFADNEHHMFVVVQSWRK
jgi:hypothetical protein